MLTVEEMNQIMQEVTLSMPEQLHTREANAFRETMREQCAELKRRGIMPDMVAEWPLCAPRAQDETRKDDEHETHRRAER